MTTLSEMMARLPEEERRKIEERAKVLIAEEWTWQDLRKAKHKTQTYLAKKLGINREDVSQIEDRSDLLLAALRGYFEEMGGKLRLVAEFPDRPTVELAGVGDLDSEG